MKPIENMPQGQNWTRIDIMQCQSILKRYCPVVYELRVDTKMVLPFVFGSGKQPLDVFTSCFFFIILIHKMWSLLWQYGMRYDPISWSVSLQEGWYLIYVICVCFCSGAPHVMTMRAPWRVSYKRQELLTRHDYLGSPRVFGEVHVSCFVCISSMSCVPGVVGFCGLSILNCHFGFLWRLFAKRSHITTIGKQTQIT